MRSLRNKGSLAWASFLSALLIVMSIGRLPTPSIRALTYVLTEGAVYAALAAVVFFKVNKWLGVWLLFVLISSQYPFILMVNQDGTINQGLTAKVKQASIFTRNAVIAGVLWYAMVALLVTRERIPIVLDVICVIAMVNAVFVIIQYFSPDVRIGEQDYKVIHIGNLGIKTLSAAGMPGLLGNANTTSGLMAMCLPCFFRNRWKVRGFPMLPFLAILAGYGMILTTSSNGVASVAAGVAFAFPFVCFHYERDRYLATAQILSGYTWAGFGIAAFWFCIDTPGIMGRWGIWQTGIPLFVHKPWMGVGMGHWVNLTGHLHAHNDIWQLVCEMGVIGGLASLVGYMGAMLLKIRWNNLLLQTAMVVIAANAFIAFPMHIPTTAMIAATLMALLTVQVREDDDVNTKPSHMVWDRKSVRSVQKLA